MRSSGGLPLRAVSGVDGGLGAVRAAVFAVTTVVLASLAHSLGGGEVPPLAAALVAGLGCWLLGLVLARRSWGVLGLTALLGGSQLVLHQVFHAVAAPEPQLPAMADMQGMPGMGAMPGMAGMGGHQAHSMLTHSMMTAGQGHTSVPMLAAHVLAVVVTAVLLAAAEAAWAFVRWARRWPGLLVEVVALPPLTGPRRVVPAGRRPRLARLVGPTRRLTRRGPPPRPAPATAAMAVS